MNVRIRTPVTWRLFPLFRVRLWCWLLLLSFVVVVVVIVVAQGVIFVMNGGTQVC